MQMFDRQSSEEAHGAAIAAWPGGWLMQMRNIVASLDALLDVDGEHRDADWARQACTVSRLAHIFVWDNRPPPASAQLIIERINRLAEVVPQARLAGSKPELIPAFAENVSKRAANLANYLAGKPSSFAPADLLRTFEGRSTAELVAAYRDELDAAVGRVAGPG